MYIQFSKTLITCIAIYLIGAFNTHAQYLSNEFFVFDNGAGRGEWTPDKQAKTLAELGYAGIGYSGTENLDERLAAFRKHNVDVFNIYVPCYLDKEIAYSNELVEAIKRLAGTDVVIWLTVQGQSSDDKAIRIVREIADLAAASNLKVALYPHSGFYVADIEDALRITQKVNRDNLGVTFNLCHELMAGSEAKFDELLERAFPHLFVVSINGADHTGGWDKLIQPLGHGVFDLNKLLRKIASLGYNGPIGLQCYNVPGNTEKNLEHNIDEWRRIVREE